VSVLKYYSFSVSKYATPRWECMCSHIDIKLQALLDICRYIFVHNGIISTHTHTHKHKYVFMRYIKRLYSLNVSLIRLAVAPLWSTAGQTRMPHLCHSETERHTRVTTFLVPRQFRHTQAKMNCACISFCMGIFLACAAQISVDNMKVKPFEKQNRGTRM
jgi:hypothetical protein